MIIQDKLVKEQNDSKNAVEEYVYDLRDKLCGVYEKYVTEEVRAAVFGGSWRIHKCTSLTSWTLGCCSQDSNRLSVMLEDTENWLYEEGEDQPKDVYVAKLEALKVRAGNKDYFCRR